MRVGGAGWCCLGSQHTSTSASDEGLSLYQSASNTKGRIEKWLYLRLFHFQAWVILKCSARCVTVTCCIVCSDFLGFSCHRTQQNCCCEVVCLGDF